MRLLLSFSICLVPLAAYAADPDPAKVFTEQCPDSRLGKVKDLNGYFPLAVPATKEGWNDRARQVREQLLVANGLWPMPEKTPLNPVIHGKIERDGYTIEKVYFSSMPGHYVSGNLYRPTKKVDGKRPAVLNPHGHWPNGRFMEATDAAVKKELATKDAKTGQPAEGTDESARYPLQAKCVGLVRMGFVVFHYDMIGYADSTAISFNEAHRAGFKSTEAELRQQSIMGWQTWNSIRAYDFLESLPDVDAKRIAVTGASGGGTQTFILCAIDDRPSVAFPAVMVSTAMQGGCYCENCSYLRIDTGNIEFAGLFAPKPLGMSAANDWTKEIETKGLPELKQLYKLFGKEDLVDARCWPEFGHNYNQVSREYMYRWFNKHVLEKDEVVKEQPFKPVPPKDLSVYNADHPRPRDELDSARLRAAQAEASDKQMKALEPKDEKTLAEFRRVAGTALRVMINDALPKAVEVDLVKGVNEIKLKDGVVVHQVVITRKGKDEAIPIVGIHDPKSFKNTLVIWVHPHGKASLFDKGELVPTAKALLAKGAGIMAPDLFQTGELTSEKPFGVNPNFAGYTYGYNRSVFANRVHDLLTVIRFAQPKFKTLHLVGWGQAGVWTAAARALAGDVVTRTVVDMNQFRFDKLTSTAHEEMLPGAVKYGGSSMFLALCAPHEVFAHNHAGTSSGHLSNAAYDASGAKDKLKRMPEKAKDAEIIEWLIR